MFSSSWNTMVKINDNFYKFKVQNIFTHRFELCANGVRMNVYRPRGIFRWGYLNNPLSKLNDLVYLTLWQLAISPGFSDILGSVPRKKLPHACHSVSQRVFWSRTVGCVQTRPSQLRHEVSLKHLKNLSSSYYLEIIKYCTWFMVSTQSNYTFGVSKSRFQQSAHYFKHTSTLLLHCELV